jgi:hypothetical protein
MLDVYYLQIASAVACTPGTVTQSTVAAIFRCSKTSSAAIIHPQERGTGFRRLISPYTQIGPDLGVDLRTKAENIESPHVQHLLLKRYRNSGNYGDGGVFAI